jgi:hypothetical protein
MDKKFKKRGYSINGNTTIWLIVYLGSNPNFSIKKGRGSNINGNIIISLIVYSGSNPGFSILCHLTKFFIKIKKTFLFVNIYLTIKEFLLK